MATDEPACIVDERFWPRLLGQGWPCGSVCRRLHRPRRAGDPYPNVYETVPQPRPPALRELFAQTLATVLHGTLSAASLGVTQLLVGRISNWFSRRDDRQRVADGVADHTTSVPYDPAAVMHVGLAYEVQLLLPNAQTHIVDPESHVFATGNRILLELRPAQPGWLDVFNIDPAGRKRVLDSRTMAGGELLTLGP